MSRPQSSQAPVESRASRRNSFGQPGVRKQRGIVLLVVLLMALGLLAGGAGNWFRGRSPTPESETTKNDGCAGSSQGSADRIRGGRRSASGFPPLSRHEQRRQRRVSPGRLLPSDLHSGSNVYIGRLPWRTLGLPDLRDSSGERLWYAVSRQFARNPTCMPNCPLTSDTLGQLTVTGIAPATNVVTSNFCCGRNARFAVKGPCQRE